MRSQFTSRSPSASPEIWAPEIWAVIPAAGSGSRLSASHTPMETELSGTDEKSEPPFSPCVKANRRQNKLLAELAGEPILIHTLRTLLRVPDIQGIVLTVSPEYQAEYRALIASELPEAPVHYAPGGHTRRESVYNGLSALPRTADIVVLHDAARPLACPAIFEAVITAVRQGSPGAVAATPIHDTVKKAGADGNTIAETVSREGLWHAQTPQAFEVAALLSAHRSVSPEITATDDARLMELAGLGPVVLVRGDERNLKITTEADLRLAEALLAMAESENPKSYFGRTGKGDHVFIS